MSISVDVLHPVEVQQNTSLTPFMYTSVALASTVESFYRSALNNLINQKITGRTGKYLPDMHVQIPTRIIYMTGLKKIRAVLDKQDYGNSTLGHYMRIGTWFVPGIAMSPMSSILEASNAGHSNPESLTTRWLRGYNSRLVREIIFAIGLNQAADIITDNFGPYVSANKSIQSASGSLCAGLVAGYFSHVPHVLSTMKLLSPQKTYAQHWGDLWMKSYTKLYGAPGMPTSAAANSTATETAKIVFDPTRVRTAKAYALLFPLGVVRRSLQIAGTFVIINGMMYGFRNKNWY